MNRICGLVFHTLKQNSVPGWSTFNITKLDVSKVTKICYKPRLFKIFNRDHPYTLTIEYYEPKEDIGIAPVISHHGGAAVYERTILTQTMTRRYRTELDCLEEIAAINRGKQSIDDLFSKLLSKLKK